MRKVYSCYVPLAKLFIAFLPKLCSLAYNLWSTRTTLQTKINAHMEVSTVITMVMILWAGDLVLGAPSNAPALEWAFGGDFRIVTFYKKKLRNYSPYVEVDGLLAAQEELRAGILRVISRAI